MRKLDDRITATKHHGLTHYPWSFVTPKGESISPLKGELKLSMHPFTVYSNAPYQENARFSTNERGLRTDTDISFKNLPKGQKRILVLGGSTAFGTGLDSNEETYAAHLARMLDHACVLNAGVIGFVSGQEVAQLVSDLLDYRPDLVITLDGFNDLFIQLGRCRIWPDIGANEFDGLVGRLVKLHQVQSNLWYGLLNAFHGIHAFCLRIYGVIKSILKIMVGRHLMAYMKSRFSFLSKKEGKKPFNAATIDELSEHYATNLSKITKMGEGFGYRHLAVLQPALISDRDSYTPAGRFHFSKKQIALYETFLEKSMEKLRKLNVAHYCAHLDFKEADTLYLDDIHLKAKGYQELASATVKILQDKGWIPSNPEMAILNRERRHRP